jgi:hypothetical protein
MRVLQTDVAAAGSCGGIVLQIGFKFVLLLFLFSLNRSELPAIEQNKYTGS